MKRREFHGDLGKISPNQLANFVVQEHNAQKAKLHYDVRLGTKSTGLYSWASKRDPKKLHPGESVPVVRTNLHQFSYKDFEGNIPVGNYGAGTVRKLHEGEAKINKAKTNQLTFDYNGDTYTLFNFGKGYDPKVWQLTKHKHKKAEEQTYYHGSPNPGLTTLRKGSYITPDKEIAALMGRYHINTGKTWSDTDLIEPHIMGQLPKWKNEPKGIPTIYELKALKEHLNLLNNPYEHITNNEYSLKKL